MKQLGLEQLHVIRFEHDGWKSQKTDKFQIETTLKEKQLILTVNQNDKQSSHTFLQYVQPIVTTHSINSINIESNLTYIVTIEGEVADSLDVQLQLTAFGKNGQNLVEYVGLGISKIIKFPDDTKYIKAMLRIAGSGEARIDKVYINGYNDGINGIKNAIMQLKSKSDYLILTNVYPEKNNLYRNMFVHRRAQLYKEEDLNVDVFRLRTSDKNLSFYEFESIPVLCGGPDELTNLIKKKIYKKILIHFVDKNMIEAIKKCELQIPIIVWIHGVETEKWYRRWFNFYQSSKALEGALLAINSNREKVEFMKEIYESKTLNIKFVFVSKWFKEAVAECDTDATVKNYSIIHNVVDDELFNYVEKAPEQRKKILSIRPYASHKYANDLTVKAILELSKKDYFDELEFNLYGDGLLFEEILNPLKNLKNVHLHNYFLSQTEIARLHKEHGIFLCPTRLDSQGVSMCEAMSSGLIPITNGVTAIPEFVDNESGFLVKREDASGLAAAIEYLFYHPEEFKRISANAANRMREQCGKNKVIKEEIALILE